MVGRRQYWNMMSNEELLSRINPERFKHDVPVVPAHELEWHARRVSPSGKKHWKPRWMKIRPLRFRDDDLFRASWGAVDDDGELFHGGLVGDQECSQRPVHYKMCRNVQEGLAKQRQAGLCLIGVETWRRGMPTEILGKVLLAAGFEGATLAATCRRLWEIYQTLGPQRPCLAVELSARGDARKWAWKSCVEKLVVVVLFDGPDVTLFGYAKLRELKISGWVDSWARIARFISRAEVPQLKRLSVTLWYASAGEVNAVVFENDLAVLVPAMLSLVGDGGEICEISMVLAHFDMERPVFGRATTWDKMIFVAEARRKVYDWATRSFMFSTILTEEDGGLRLTFDVEEVSRLKSLNVFERKLCSWTTSRLRRASEEEGVETLPRMPWELLDDIFEQVLLSQTQLNVMSQTTRPLYHDPDIRSLALKVAQVHPRWFTQCCTYN
ncbi:hypothetical protein BDZ89DRAFT_1048847 [Hymenopellis radicata]|nr:hypothetical protein BDZ89DRAFT_1048847 [Hymenopellis radicata]